MNAPAAMPFGTPPMKRGYRTGVTRVRPRMVIEDPPETDRIEIDWNYVAACAKRTPNVWLKVVVDQYRWTPPWSGSQSNIASLRHNNIRAMNRMGNFYVRYDAEAP